MPSRSRARTTAARTEARRRARLEARGDLPGDEIDDEEPPEPQRRPGGGFLRLIFPPAPPLADKPDPLAGFTGSGRARPILAWIHLLRANPLVWLGFGIVAGIGYLLSTQLPRGDPLGFVANIAMFGALAAAGWFGWQRPALYGAAAALVGYVLTTAIGLVLLVVQGTPAGTVSDPGVVLVNLVLYALIQASLGLIAGWYGGYLRRRQASLPTAARRPRR